MKSKNPSLAIYRDREINDRMPASAPIASGRLLRLEDGRAECFEVILRMLLVVCIGVAMLTCGAGIDGSAQLTNRARQYPVAIDVAGLAAHAAAAVLPKAVVGDLQSLR